VSSSLGEGCPLLGDSLLRTVAGWELPPGRAGNPRRLRQGERGDFDPPYGRSLAADVMWAKHPAFPTFAVTRTTTTPSPSV